MKRSWLAGPLLMVTIVSTSLALPSQGMAATALTLSPTSYFTLTGEDGGQDVSALASVDADALMLMTPLKAKYKGYRIFVLPGEVDPTTITSVQLQATYRGPNRKHQTWSWTIYDWAKKRWLKLGNSAAAVENEWSPLTLNLKLKAGQFGKIVGPGHRQILVMVASSNTKYDAELDAESLVVTTSADVTITPPPAWTPPPAHTIWVPPPGTTWQWQLTVPTDTSYDVEMYDVDLDDTPKATIDALHAQGRTVICYFSPGSYEKWRADANQFPKIVIGKKYIGWAGEYWLDIRQKDLLAPIMTARLDKAVEKGCDGVEPDNIHGYTEPTGFPLTAEDQIAYNTWLAEEAHKRYLSIGLKNDLYQVETLSSLYDWALNEQCFEFDECDVYQAFVAKDKAVFGVEYEGNPADFCPAANNAGYNWLRKNLDLDAWMIPCTNF